MVKTNLLFDSEKQAEFSEGFCLIETLVFAETTYPYYCTLGCLTTGLVKSKVCCHQKKKKKKQNYIISKSLETSIYEIIKYLVFFCFFQLQN